MRRAGTPWGEIRCPAPPHGEGGAQAISDTVPSSPVQITSDFITDQVMRGLEQGGQGSMPPVSHSAFGWGQGLGEWARQHVPEPVLSAMGLPPTSAAPMTPDPLPMQRAGQPWGEMQYFRQPPLESFSPSSFGNPSGQMGPDIINVNIPPGTGGRPGQAAQQPLVDPAVMGTLTDQVNALRGQGTGSGNVEVAGVQYRYNPVLGIFEVVR